MKPSERTKLLSIWSLPALATQKERDARDLDKLADLMEHNVDVMRQWRTFFKEPPQNILRRYLGKYLRADRTTENELIARYFWLRQTVYRGEKQEYTAEMVAEVLKAAGVKKSRATVWTIAKRAETRKVARSWIAQQFRQFRLKHTRDSIAEAMLGTFEPTPSKLLALEILENMAEVVQRSDPSLHPKP